MKRPETWPFDDPPNVTALTTRQVLEENFPILLVTHDEDDGTWQILCGTSNHVDDGRVVDLGCMFERDPTIGLLADLPLGWRASRESVDDAWLLELSPEDDDED